MYCLAIETSCDDTSLAIFDDKKLLAMDTRSQIDVHLLTGGVVPEVAARLHSSAVFECLESVLSQAQITLADLGYIAVTRQPGLPPSLLVGRTLAKTLGVSLSIPVVDIDHIEAHIFANYLDREESDILFPALVLTVSGGHNELYLWQDRESLQLIGQTRDDAAGEAFDKVAKMMQLGYPGGPIISRLASEYTLPLHGIFPDPMDDGSYDFSFSGLKSAVKRWIDAHGGPGALSDTDKREIAAEFQAVVVKNLVKKTLSAAQNFPVRSLVLAGGVSANDTLREKLSQAAHASGYTFIAPTQKRFSMDNAAMIGIRAYYLTAHNTALLSR